MFTEESVSFSCEINVSSGWEYLWYRDGTPLAESSNKYSISSVGKTNTGSYTCQAKRGRTQVFLSDSSQTMHLEIEGKVNIYLQCAGTEWVAVHLWSVMIILIYLAGQICYEQVNSCWYHIIHVHFYFFVCLEKKPKPLMTQQPDDHKVYTGESVSFKCSLEISSGWSYSWYKDGVLLTNNNASFSIHNATSLNNGIYKCMARRDKTMFNTEHSDGRSLHISGEPKKVTLCCHFIYCCHNLC